MAPFDSMAIDPMLHKVPSAVGASVPAKMTDALSLMATASWARHGQVMYVAQVSIDTMHRKTYRRKIRAFPCAVRSLWRYLSENKTQRVYPLGILLNNER
jgi:hypothetical protein